MEIRCLTFLSMHHFNIHCYWWALQWNLLSLSVRKFLPSIFICLNNRFHITVAVISVHYNTILSYQLLTKHFKLLFFLPKTIGINCLLMIRNYKIVAYSVSRFCKTWYMLNPSFVATFAQKSIIIFILNVGIFSKYLCNWTYIKAYLLNSV